jgi:hypothetical protein
MTVLIGLLATTLVFVIYRFRRFKLALWISCISGALTWFVVYSLIELVGLLF